MGACGPWREPRPPSTADYEQAKMAAAKQSSLRPSSSREGSIAMALEVAGYAARTIQCWSLELAG